MKPWATDIFFNKASRADSKDEWCFLREQQGIRIYYQARPGTRLMAFKGETVFHAPIERVFTVLTDPTLRLQWVDRMLECQLLESSEDGSQLIEYFRINMPWPLCDRYFTTKTSVDYSPEDSYLSMVSEAAENSQLSIPDDLVRGRVEDARTTLRQVDAKNTAIVMSALVDPGGVLPHLVVNLFQREWAYNTLSRLHLISKNQEIPICQLYHMVTSNHKNIS